MTSIVTKVFRGMLPSVSNTKLETGYATTAVNTKLLSGDIEGYYDIGNPFQLSKAAPILALEQAANGDWLQWSASELASFAFDIRAVPGTVVGDTTGRRYITGYNSPVNGSVPQVTNTFFATDPSQQGAHTAGAYPYVTYPLGIADPASPPANTTPSPSPLVDDFDFAQEASVNELSATGGSTGINYLVGDKLLVAGGTLVTGFTADTGAARIIVTDINPSTGAITGLSLDRGGFYTTGNAPSLAAHALTYPTGVTGTGSGGTATVQVVVANNFSGFSQYNVGTPGSTDYYIRWHIGGGGDYAPNQWQVDSAQGDLTVSYSNEAFGLVGATSWVFQVDTQSDSNPDLVVFLTGTYNGTNAMNGPAVVLSFHDSTFALYSSTIGTNGNTVGGTIVAQNSYAPNYAVKYRVRVTAVAQQAASTKGFNVTVTLADATAPGTILQTLQGFIPFEGDQFGVGSNHRGAFGGANIASFENIYVQVTSPASNITVESTNYVYTYVQQFPGDPLTQESGPSDPSPTIDVYIDSTTNPSVRSPVTVTIPPAPTGENIVAYNLYRLVEDPSGNETYTFVTQLTSSTTLPVTYVDSAQDDAIGPAVLISQDWMPPPANMQGILALPNGIMAGFFANVLCLSAQNYPHAWPVGNQYATDTNIQGLSAIDTTVLLVTQAYPYTAFGTDPSAFNMTKEVSIQGCVAPRSIATHKKYGVLFVSGNGLCYYKGQGLLDLVRIGPSGESPPFSYEQWQKLVPSSMIAELHDDYYYFWYSNGTTKSGFILDLTPGGFGLIGLDVHVTEAYVDKSVDKLYLVPDFSVYAVNGSVVSTALNIVSQWEYATTMRERTWERDQYMLPRPAAFARARVRYGVDTENDPVTGAITLTLTSADAAGTTGTAFNGAVANQNIFTIASKPGIKWNMKLDVTGYLAVNSLELAEASTEILD